MEVGKNLRKIRKAKGISQERLAKEAGVSQQLISQLESGKNVTTNKLPEIASVLGCEVWEIAPKFTPGVAPATGWAALVKNAALAALEEGASPADIRAVIERIAPLPNNEVGPLPPIEPRHERRLKDLAETSSEQLDSHRNKSI